ncbi:MAG: leucine-rich repeat domain-containing protein, partial [Planctomycetia bacterium]
MEKLKVSSTRQKIHNWVTPTNRKQIPRYQTKGESMMSQLQRTITVCLMIGFCITFYHQASASPIVVTFPDANLEAAVRTKLGISSDPITADDMATIETLGIYNRNVSNIQGVEYAINMTLLGLGLNDVSDLTPLTNLTNLTRLSLNGNEISDVSPLVGLTNLEDLRLGNNNLTDITPLTGLTNVNYLTLGHNNVTNLSPLAGMTTMTTLQMNNNNFSDISPLSGMTAMTWLDIRQNDITDISPLSGMKELGFLSLGRNNISDLSPLVGMTKLDRLYLSENNVSDLTPLVGLTSLNSLNLSENNLNDLTPLVQVPSLEILWLSDNNLDNAAVAGLAGMTNLTELMLSSNNISDITSLTGMTSLIGIGLDYNQVSDISVMAGMTNLQGINLDYNQVKDISPVAKLKKLEVLSMYNNRVEIMDLSGANLPLLRSLDIHNSPVKEVLLTNATMNQLFFNTLMDGGGTYDAGLADLSGPYKHGPSILNMNWINFSDVSDFSLMYGMDDLEELSFRGASNLNGNKVVAMTNELASLNWLDVGGLWDSFDASEQNALCAWDAIPGNTLITTPVPEPTTLSMLLVLAGLITLWKKRKSTLTFCLMIGFLAGLSGQAQASPIVVNFPDSNLKTAVRDKLGIPSDPITIANMESMTGSFSANHENIYNIQGMEYATNLSLLTLYENHISDISPVSNLTNLTALSIWDNNISDISPVSGLTNLSWLSLSFNEVTDISSVVGLTNLTELYLNHNNISNISAVSGLTNLTNLAFSANNVSDISPLATLTNMVELGLYENNISDISALAGMTNLSHISLFTNSISNLSPLAGLTDLTKVFLHHNNISDTSPLSHLTDPRTLLLNSNNIQTLDFKNINWPLLAYFNISQNPLEEVFLNHAVLSQYTFDTLMDGGGISTYQGVAEKSDILHMDMSGVDFADITDLSTMYTADDLEELSLRGASNLDGSEVVAMTNELASLDWLDVGGLWDSFDATEKNALYAWDAVPGNTLVITP